MKRFVSIIRTGVLASFGIALTGLVLSSCVKNNDNPAHIPSAGLMSFNLAPDENALLLRITGNYLTPSPLSFTSYSGGYQGIYIGNRMVEAIDYATSQTLASASADFKDSSYYSLFFVGYNGKYRNIIAEDKLNSLPAVSNEAYVRYINAVADSTVSPTVSVKSGSTAVFNDNAAFGSISDFKPVAAGDVVITVNNATGVDATRTISLEARKVYTILLAGKPGETSESKKVQIRFITNGTVDASN